MNVPSNLLPVSTLITSADNQINSITIFSNLAKVRNSVLLASQYSPWNSQRFDGQSCPAKKKQKAHYLNEEWEKSSLFSRASVTSVCASSAASGFLLVKDAMLRTTSLKNGKGERAESNTKKSVISIHQTNRELCNWGSFWSGAQLQGESLLFLPMQCCTWNGTQCKWVSGLRVTLHSWLCLFGWCLGTFPPKKSFCHNFAWKWHPEELVSAALLRITSWRKKRLVLVEKLMSMDSIVWSPSMFGCLAGFIANCKTDPDLNTILDSYFSHWRKSKFLLNQ